MRLKIAWLATEQSVSATVTSKWHTGYGGPSNGSEWQNMAIESEVKIYENHRKDARYDEKTICPTMAAHYGTGGGNVPFVIEKLRVRKLTPIECERLQGFADNYTRIPWKGKSEEECPDSPRYKAIGNSWAVPCVRWIGKRIQAELEKSK